MIRSMFTKMCVATLTERFSVGLKKLDTRSRLEIVGSGQYR